MKKNPSNLVQIGEIHYHNSDLLLGCYLDVPVANSQEQTYNIIISGWVMAVEHKILGIWFTNNTLVPEVLRSAQPVLPRPDVAAIYPERPEANNCGFSVILSALGLPVESNINVVIVLEGDIRVIAVTINIKRLHLMRASYKSQLNPLMITSLGRSGSTWLMRLLMQHPAIVAHNSYPYEAYFAKYWLHNLFKLLSDPINYLNQIQADKLFQLNNDWTHSHIHNDEQIKSWFNHNYVRQAANFCTQAMDSIYLDIATAQGEKNRQLRYFMEKFGPSHSNVLLNELMPNSREIILVRDFRDILCSSLQFNDKIKTQDFGLEAGTEEEQLIATTKFRANSLLTYWQNCDSEVYVVNYEDLILNPQHSLTQICVYLGIKANKSIITKILHNAQNNKEFQQHTTSKNAADSIGRWQRELSPFMQTKLQQALQEELQAFGYL
jgi:hypothetical protein